MLAMLTAQQPASEIKKMQNQKKNNGAKVYNDMYQTKLIFYVV